MLEGRCRVQSAFHVVSGDRWITRVGASADTFEPNTVYAAASDLYAFDQPEDEAELTTNQRFEKLCRLEQLIKATDAKERRYRMLL